MKFHFMAEHLKEFAVGQMAELLGVSRSGFYAWAAREPSQRAQEDDRIVEEIRGIQEEVKFRYGSPRITAELAREGLSIGHNRVARLMSEHELGARPAKKYRGTTDSSHQEPVAENLLNRQFQVAEPNKVWAGDIIYLPTAEGWMYLAVVLDLHSRAVVGWALSTTLHTGVVLEALMMALLRRRPAKGLLFHSDRGAQYCSGDFRNAAAHHGLIQSMSRKGNCWDNSVVESFFKTLKQELLQGKAFTTREEARRRIFEYIEVFYNRVRLHSSLGYCSPAEYERKAA